MAKTLQFKRFSSTILANTVGASGELIIDSTKNLITVHDGSTPGGWPVARESVINAINNAQSINIQQSRDTANLALVQANLAFVQINADLNLQGGLNSANANIGMLIGIQTTQNTNITTANNAAWASFNKANNALANTSGTFGGNLNVAGTMNVNNILTVTTSPPTSSPSITIISTQNQNLSLQAVSNTWTFGSNGNTTFPTGLVLGAPRGVNTVNFTSAIDKEFQIETGTSTTSKLWRFGTDGKLTAPGNLQVDGGKIILNTGGNAYVESVDYGVNSANSAVNIFGGPYQKIKLRAGFGTEAAWTFATDGTTTFPTNVSINYSGGNVQFPRIIADSGKAFSIQAQGNTGSAAMAWTVDPDAAGQYAQIGVTKNGGDNLAKILLSAQSDSSNAATAKTWVFNQTGAFTFPDNTIQNTAFTGTAIDQIARNTANTAAANSAGVVIDTLARTTSNTATNNITILQGVNTSQNVRLDYSNTTITIIQGVDTTQNTRITNVENTATAAYAKANTNISSNLTLTVTNSGVGAYLIDGSSNPTVTLYRGVTYTFSINASGHPFYIQTVSGAYSSGNVYTSGVTGGGTQVGTLTFTVPLDAPSNLYYVCQNHSSMNGAFLVQNLISTINTHISIAQLKSLANSSATYSDFRTAIASL
jgi:hypothetical protein